MIFNFSVEDIKQKVSSQDITPQECQSIWTLIDKQQYGNIFEKLLINPFCSPSVVKMAFADYAFAKYAIRNPSLDVFIYRDKDFIDKSCVHFISAMFQDRNHVDYETLRFVDLALKVFPPDKIIESYIIDHINESQKKELGLNYLKDIRASFVINTYTITDIAVQFLKLADDQEIIQSVYDTFPRFNIHVIKLFAANKHTPKGIIDNLINQLSAQMSVDKHNLYYDLTLQELLKHPNCHQPKIEMIATLEEKPSISSLMIAKEQALRRKSESNIFD